MGLADDLDARARALTIDEVLEELDEKDSAALLRALKGDAWASQPLARRLTDEGFPTTRYAVEVWRERNGA